jgi:hypothetical protein
VVVALLVGLSLGTERAEAHGSCHGTSSRSVEGTTTFVTFGGTTYCTQNTDILRNLNVLWSLGSGFPFHALENSCWDQDERQNQSECSWTHYMDHQRCYFTFGLHDWLDHHTWLFVPYLHIGVDGSAADTPIYAACRL